jgi:hypothetical protein
MCVCGSWWRVAEWLPSELREFTYIPSADGLDSNLLLLFHGLGDTPAPYATFFRSIKLPQTAGLVLRAPLPLPFEMGYGWFRAFDDVTCQLIRGDVKGETRRVESLGHTRYAVLALIRVLVERCNWALQQLFFLVPLFVLFLRVALFLAPISPHFASCYPIRVNRASLTALSQHSMPCAI